MWLTPGVRCSRMKPFKVSTANIVSVPLIMMLLGLTFDEVVQRMHRAEEERAKLQFELESNMLFVLLGHAEAERDTLADKLQRVKRQRDDTCKRLAIASAESTNILGAVIEAKLEVDGATVALRQVSTLLAAVSKSLTVHDDSDVELPYFNKINSPQKNKNSKRERVKGKGKEKQDEFEDESDEDV